MSEPPYSTGRDHHVGGTRARDLATPRPATPVSADGAVGDVRKRSSFAAAPAGALEHLGFEPSAAPNNDASIGFEWETVAIGSNESRRCTVTCSLPHTLTVTVEQGTYVRKLTGNGRLSVPVVPLAAAGTMGRLTARDDITGASADYTWEWKSRGLATFVTEGRTGRRMNPWQMVKQLVALAAGRPVPATAAQAATAPLPECVTVSPISPFDGDWEYRGPYEPWSMRISGSTGVCLVTNAPRVYGPGDTMLYIDRVEGHSFVGRLIYTDGKFREDRGELVAPNQLEISLARREVLVEPECILYRR